MSRVPPGRVRSPPSGGGHRACVRRRSSSSSSVNKGSSRLGSSGSGSSDWPFGIVARSASSSMTGGVGPARSTARSSSVKAPFRFSSNIATRRTASGHCAAGKPSAAPPLYHPHKVSWVQTGWTHSSKRVGTGGSCRCIPPALGAVRPSVETAVFCCACKPLRAREKNGWAKRVAWRPSAGSESSAPPPSRCWGSIWRRRSIKSDASGGRPSGMLNRRACTRRKVR
mmetsp:Transcript_5761/g.17731  ORF Transcript_5761/g.17731 Transcript_5761/m.17731 type:complete len:226 (-) Transcript_5761:882-1559(-)